MNNGWVLHEESDFSWWHCDRPGFWEDDEVYCSKCLRTLDDLVVEEK